MLLDEAVYDLLQIINNNSYQGRWYNKIKSNLDYSDLLGPDKIVRIIKGPGNQKYEY